MRKYGWWWRRYERLRYNPCVLLYSIRYMGNESFDTIINAGDDDTPSSWQYGFEKRPEAEHIDDRDMAGYLRVYREEYREKLIKMAAQARHKAVSYREKPFRVGSAILTVDNTREQYAMYASHNWTPSQGTRTGGAKRCAERNAADSALLENNSAFIVAITTLSSEKSTGDHSEAHDVLHPCQECRTLMRQMIAQGHLSEQSVLCSVNDLKEMVIDEKSVGEILDLYKDDPAIEIQPSERAA